MVLLLLFLVDADPKDLVDATNAEKVWVGPRSRQHAIHVVLWVPRTNSVLLAYTGNNPVRSQSVGRILQLPIQDAWLDHHERLAYHHGLLWSAPIPLEVQDMVHLCHLLYHCSQRLRLPGMPLSAFQDPNYDAQARGDFRGFHDRCHRMLRIFHSGKLFMKIPLTRTNIYSACIDLFLTTCLFLLFS